MALVRAFRKKSQTVLWTTYAKAGKIRQSLHQQAQVSSPSMLQQKALAESKEILSLLQQDELAESEWQTLKGKVVQAFGPEVLQQLEQMSAYAGRAMDALDLAIADSEASAREVHVQPEEIFNGLRLKDVFSTADEVAHLGQMTSMEQLKSWTHEKFGTALSDAQLGALWAQRTPEGMTQMKADLAAAKGISVSPNELQTFTADFHEAVESICKPPKNSASLAEGTHYNGEVKAALPEKFQGLFDLAVEALTKAPYLSAWEDVSARSVAHLISGVCTIQLLGHTGPVTPGRVTKHVNSQIKETMADVENRAWQLEWCTPIARDLLQGVLKEAYRNRALGSDATNA